MARVKAERAPTRERILGATAELLRRRGYSGTGMKEIVRVAEAPFASVYHFFPAGKEQLGAEAIEVSGRAYNELVSTFFGGKRDIVKATRAFFAAGAQMLELTGYEDACPIATVALEVASQSEPMRLATARVFESWIRDLTECFEAAGIRKRDARPLAITMFMLLEGAFLLCRAWRSTEPMKIAGRAAVKEATAAVKAGR